MTNGYLPSAHSVTPAALNFKLQHSREDAAEILGISLRTLDRLIAGKEIAVRRIGRRVLITRDALVQFTKRDHTTTGDVQ